MYTEASSGGAGDRTRLRIQSMFSSEICLTFFYHMYGEDIGSLSVFIVPDDRDQNEQELWKLQGYMTYF